MSQLVSPDASQRIYNELNSTRDTSEDPRSYSLKQSILFSQPSDGGLFVFKDLPHFSEAELGEMQGLSYQDLAFKILRRFNFKIPDQDLKAIIDDAYRVRSEDGSRGQWDDKDIVPVRHVKGNHYLAELFQGPTGAFKDIALQLLPRLLSYYGQANGGDTRIMRALGASTGDTIAGAHYGVGNVPGLRSIFLLPQEGPSEMQRWQATANEFRNALTILINGDFDDGQKVVKKILSDPKYADLKAEHNFIGFNSINIARIMAQIVYYFSTYMKLVERGAIKNVGDPVNFSDPSGNFGDGLAGMYAKLMGLPIDKINIATNANDGLTQVLTEGTYYRPDKAIRTEAMSQDVRVASNFERALLIATDGDHGRVKELMETMDREGSYKLLERERQRLTETLTTTTADDGVVMRTIEDVYGDPEIFANNEATGGMVIDPHTATAVYGAFQTFGENPDIPTITLATASPLKFELPEGVPKDMEHYEKVMKPLRERGEFFLESSVDEDELVETIVSAPGIIEQRMDEAA